MQVENFEKRLFLSDELSNTVQSQIKMIITKYLKEQI